MNKFDEGGNCKYCMQMRQKVKVGRTDMAQPFRLYIAALLVGLGGAYVFRSVIYVQNIQLWTALEQGQSYALDRYNHLTDLNHLAFFVLMGASVFRTHAYTRWILAGHGNAMTRPDIGLRWARVVPSAKAHFRWNLSVAVTLGISIVLALTVSDPHDPQAMRVWTIVQITVSAIVLILLVGAASAARRMQRELLVWLDSPMPVPVPDAGMMPEPEPIG